MSMAREFVRLQADMMLAQQERVLGLAARPVLKRADLAHGEGRAVLLLPGFGANEALLQQLNRLLMQYGYESETFIPGFPKDETLREFIDELSLSLSRKVEELTRRTGKAVSLVGQSAGGIYSREFARRYPESIDRVITLGSPTIYPENLHLQNKVLNALVERRFGTSAEHTFGDGRFVHWDKRTPQVPYVAIYSPIDGAVRAQTVVIPESQLNIAPDGAIRENIAVISSHFGMVLNPFVMLAVADRLGSEVKNWQAFDPELYLPQVLRRLSRLAYPQASAADYEIPSMDLHAGQPRGRDARERVVRTLKTEHSNIGTLLDTLLEEVGSSAAAATGVPNYTVVSGILDYLHSYTDGFHHPREDLLFERLREREPSLGQIIGALVEEHQWIEQEGHALEQAVKQHAQDKGFERRNKSLDAHCRRYVKKLRAHLRTEETQVFPLADKLHRHDWMAVDKGLSYEADPLFGREIQQRYEELADALAGRVEGIGMSVTMNEVLGFEASANGFEALGSGLARLREQRLERAKKRRENRRNIIRQAVEEKSLGGMARLPFRLARENSSMARDDARAGYAAVREVAADVLKSVRGEKDT